MFSFDKVRKHSDAFIVFYHYLCEKVSRLCVQYVDNQEVKKDLSKRICQMINK